MLATTSDAAKNFFSLLSAWLGTNSEAGRAAENAKQTEAYTSTTTGVGGFFVAIVEFLRQLKRTFADGNFSKLISGQMDVKGFYGGADNRAPDAKGDVLGMSPDTAMAAGAGVAGVATVAAVRGGVAAKVTEAASRVAPGLTAPAAGGWLSKLAKIPGIGKYFSGALVATTVAGAVLTANSDEVSAAEATGAAPADPAAAPALKADFTEAAPNSEANQAKNLSLGGWTYQALGGVGHGVASFVGSVGGVFADGVNATVGNAARAVYNAGNYAVGSDSRADYQMNLNFTRAAQQSVDDAATAVGVDLNDGPASTASMLTEGGLVVAGTVATLGLGTPFSVAAAGTTSARVAATASRVTKLGSWTSSMTPG